VKLEIIGRGRLVENIVRENNFKKFAEIGVWKSGLCKAVLKRAGDTLEEYWAIDPWEHSPDGSVVQKRRKPDSWFLMHKHSCELMMQYSNLKVVKMTSEKASVIFPDGYFDMVYIDAIHTFDHVTDDIGYWLPKVREGGIISGHDYGSLRWPDVKEAVDKYFGRENLEIFEVVGTWIKRV